MELIWICYISLCFYICFLMLYHPFLSDSTNYLLVFLCLLLMCHQASRLMKLFFWHCRLYRGHCIVMLNHLQFFVWVIWCFPPSHTHSGQFLQLYPAIWQLMQMRVSQDSLQLCKLHSIYHFNHELHTIHHMQPWVSPSPLFWSSML